MSGNRQLAKADIHFVIVRGTVRAVDFIRSYFGMGWVFWIFRLGRHGWNSVMDETGSCQEIKNSVRGVNESWTDFQSGYS